MRRSRKGGEQAAEGQGKVVSYREVLSEGRWEVDGGVDTVRRRTVDLNAAAARE